MMYILDFMDLKYYENTIIESLPFEEWERCPKYNYLVTFKFIILLSTYVEINTYLKVNYYGHFFNFVSH